MMRRKCFFRIFIAVLISCLLLTGCGLFEKEPQPAEKEEASASSDYTKLPESSVESASEPEEPESSESSEESEAEEPEESTVSEESEVQEESEPEEIPTETETESDEGLLPQPDTENPSFNELFLQNSLDAAYEEEIAIAASVAEMAEICDRYADLWSEEVDNAYRNLLAAADEEQYASYKSEQEEWIAGKDRAIREIVQTAQEQGGSMALLNSASQVMTFYRDRAIVLYERYYQYDPNFTFNFQANG